MGFYLNKNINMIINCLILQPHSSTCLLQESTNGLLWLPHQKLSPKDSTLDGLQGVLRKCKIADEDRAGTGVLDLKRIPCKKDLKLCFCDDCDCCFDEIILTYLVVLKDESVAKITDDDGDSEYTWINYKQDASLPGKLLGPEPFYYSRLIDNHFQQKE